MTRALKFVDIRLHPLRRRSLMMMWAVALACQASAQTSEEEELALSYGEKPFVSIATGSRVPLSRAPAVATVITAEDIQAMGASDLDEVLETVPGLHVARSTQAYSPVYAIRGINQGFNPQVLMLINGVPITTAYVGNRGNVWGGFPLENVARIEVIRGPGSALYGADAFSGVINVITKTSAEIDGTEVGVRAGAFSAVDAWVLHGGKWGAVDVAAYLRVGQTEGMRRTIKADAQSGIDAFFPPVSLAPGPISNGRDFVDGSLDLGLDKWRLRMGYRERLRVGSGTGIASALDPTGENYSQNLSADLNYEDRQFAQDWAVNMQLSWMHYKEFSNLTLFPPGATFAWTSPSNATVLSTFQDGVIGNPDKWERHARLNASAVYTGFADHRIRLGLGTEREDLYKVGESKNFIQDSGGIRSIGTGSVADVIDVTRTAPFVQPHDRTKHFAYVQDEWNFADDLTLTAGVRHDRYSDFGSTTNPRLALVWDAAYNVTTKLLYGTAFRAPAFSELYAINNPVVTGNPDIKPEKIRTLEAAVSWQPTTRLQLGVNIFHYEMSDIIRLVNSVYQNTGRQTGNGLEFEATWDPSQELRLSGNYSYQRSVDKATDHDAGNTPRHHVYARADWRFMSGWALHTQLNWVGERARVAGDTRPALEGYETVDLTLRTNQDSKPWDVALSVRNLFDADGREPSAYDRSPGQPFISLPDDFPIQGRSFYVQFTYRF